MKFILVISLCSFINNKKKLKIPKYLTDELPVPTNETE